jgi:hypothetical protein
MWPFQSKKRGTDAIRDIFSSAGTNMGTFPQSRSLDADLLAECDMDGLFAYGIFNPMGPTLAIISLLKLKPFEVSLLHYRMLNPFAQASSILGVLPRNASPDQLLELVPNAFIINEIGDTTLVGSLPSFFLHGGTQDRLVLCMTCLYQHVDNNDRLDEVTRELQTLKDFKGRPWDRATHQMTEAFKGIAAQRKPVPMEHPEPASTQQTDKDVLIEWQRFLGSAEHLAEELRGFLTAWDGSIGAQKGNFLAQSAMPLKQMLFSVEQSNQVFMQQMMRVLK